MLFGERLTQRSKDAEHNILKFCESVRTCAPRFSDTLRLMLTLSDTHSAVFSQGTVLGVPLPSRFLVTR